MDRLASARGKDQRQAIFRGRSGDALGACEPDGGRARKCTSGREPGPTQHRTATSLPRLDKANRDLERLDQTKSDFISIASHELRTPLTTIIGYTEMLSEDQTLPPAVHTMLQSISRGTRRLHEIMDSMFDIAQIDTRTLQLN